MLHCSFGTRASYFSHSYIKTAHLGDFFLHFVTIFALIYKSVLLKTDVCLSLDGLVSAGLTLFEAQLCHIISPVVPEQHHPSRFQQACQSTDGRTHPETKREAFNTKSKADYSKWKSLKKAHTCPGAALRAQRLTLWHLGFHRGRGNWLRRRLSREQRHSSARSRTLD